MSRVSRSRSPRRRNRSPHTSPSPITYTAAHRSPERDATPSSFYGNEGADRTSPQLPTNSTLGQPASPPKTPPQSSVSDDLSGSLSPLTPQEEQTASFVWDDEASIVDAGMEMFQLVTVQVGVDLAKEVAEDPIEPFTTEDVEMDGGMAPEEEVPPVNVYDAFDPFTEYLYFRFGLTHPSDGPPYPVLQTWTGALTDEDFNDIVGRLNYRDSVFADADLRKSVYHFMQPLLDRKDPPAGLLDLNYHNPRALVRAAARVTVSDLTEVTARPLYRLQSGFEDHEWILVVPDASVAVECLRRELLSTHDIVYFFLRRGTPFTLGHIGTTSTLGDDSHLITWSPMGFKPDLKHFQRWETTVRDFLVSLRGHLVWRLGGLYWRIALYILGTVPGPQDLIENDTGFLTVKLRSGLYKEPLTPAEVAILIGLVNVENPNPNAPEMRMSYFPLPNVADGTALLSSAWTPVSEGWFVAHLESVRAGGPGWRSQNQWRKVLRGATTAHPSYRRLEGYNRELATEWLKL